MSTGFGISDSTSVQLPLRGGTRCPADCLSLGYTVWHILGGYDANFTHAAFLLHVDRAWLTKLMQGGREASRGQINIPHWEEVFAEHYPDAWHRFGPQFEVRARVARPRSGAQIREPDNKDGFGHLLWSILAAARPPSDKLRDD